MTIDWQDADGGVHGGTLFAALAALAGGEAWSFPALRPHQREAWHSFTCQVAAMALIRSGETGLPQNEAGWRDLLLTLTPGQPEAWSLVVDDWTKPALLQPPVAAEANRADYKSRLPTPDALDMLATAKNHDVKQERIAQADEQDWLFALVTLQTSEGYGGSGNQSISRMNGGLSNRMSLALRPTGGAAAAFRRDVARLVADARARPDRRSGLGLLWLTPWDGTDMLDYARLDELYVEICRRVRLSRSEKGLVARGAISKVTRVAGKELNGKTEDPWAPIKADNSASVTHVGSFTHRALANLLDRKKTTPPLLARTHPEDDRTGLSIVAAALVRGQGKTEGLHRRSVPISRQEEIEEIGDTTALDRIGEVAAQRSAETGEAGRRLRRALLSLVQGGPDQVRLDDDAGGRKVEPWVRAFDRRADQMFFDEAFWSEAARDPGAHRQAWRERLRDLARMVFEEAAEAAPRTEVRRIRAHARARSYLEVQMHRWLKELADGQ